MSKKVVLGFSGGLDTSFCVKYLSEDMGYEVHSIVVNTGGFSDEELVQIEAHAYKLGVQSHTAVNAVKPYYDSILKYLVFGNVLKNNTYPLSVSAERLAQALHIAAHVKKLEANAVAHGSTGAGNDQVRFEMCAQALDAKIRTIAPWRDAEFIESFKGRSDLLAYCTKHGIPVDAKPKSNYSIDENLFHTSYESGVLEDASATYEESMFKMTVSPQAAPETSVFVDVEFEKGVPVKLTNKTDGTVKVS